MLTEIAENLLFLISQAGITREVSFDALAAKTAHTLSRPAACVTIHTATYKQKTQNSSLCHPIVTLYLVVKGFKEKERKTKNFDLISAIVNTLLFSNLGLPLQNRLQPIGFSEITDDSFGAAGVSLYKLDFTCSFEVVYTPDDEEEIGPLKKIINNYYLEIDDGVVDLEGEVDLTEIYGGNAHSSFTGIDVYGGSAGSLEFEVTINGGDAGTTY